MPMKLTVCLLLSTLPLAAQSPFRTTRHAGLPPIYAGLCFAQGDVDGDGDLDLVVANDYAQSQLLLNDGNGLFVDATAGRLVTPANNDAHAIALADLDGDGDLDLVVGNEDFVGNRVYLNNGVGVFTDVTATALPPTIFDTKNLVLADFDGDGDVDLLTVDFPNSHYYTNNGAGVFTDTTATNLVGVAAMLGQEWTPAAPAADLDGDGDLDVLLSGVGGLLQNQGGVLSPFPNQLPAVAQAPHFLADVDGDGDLDLFATGARLLYANQGNGTFVDVTAAAFATPPANGLASIDVDLDGDIDLVTASQLWLNNGVGSFAAVPVSTGLQYFSTLGRMAADFDGDGDIDLPGVPNHLRHVAAANPPRRGGTYTLDAYARPGTAPFVAVCAARGAGVLPFPFGVLRLDPGSFQSLAVLPMASSSISLSWMVPNLPALVGTAVHFQAIVDDPLTGPAATNTFRDAVQ